MTLHVQLHRLSANELRENARPAPSPATRAAGASSAGALLSNCLVVSASSCLVTVAAVATTFSPFAQLAGNGEHTVSSGNHAGSSCRASWLLARSVNRRDHSANGVVLGASTAYPPASICRQAEFKSKSKICQLTALDHQVVDHEQQPCGAFWAEIKIHAP